MCRHFHFTILWAIVIIVASGFCSCGDSIPSEYLQPKELEDVLYDYHVALGMLNGEMRNDQNRAYNERLYKLAVLKKHNVSEEKFENSMVYYMRHAEDLQKVYKSLTERVRAEASQVGASVSAMRPEELFKEIRPTYGPLSQVSYSCNAGLTMFLPL